MKKFLAMLLTIAMLCSLAVPAVAATPETDSDSLTTTTAAADPGLEAANALNELGLFKGIGNDANGSPVYDLNRAPTRNEGIVMLLRILGVEAEAGKGECKMPFTDVTSWAAPYVAYAYEHKLTNGYSPTTFGGEDPISATQYLTLVLRAMGYVDNEDFVWDSAWTLTDKLGMTDGTIQSKEFLRSDVAAVSLKALSTPCKNGKLLAETLVEAGVFTQEQAEAVGVLEPQEPQGPQTTPAPQVTPTPTPVPTPSETPLVLVHNGEGTGIDPRQPNGDVEPIKASEMADYVDFGSEPNVKDVDEGFEKYEAVYDSGAHAYAEYGKYVQVSDNIVGRLTSLAKVDGQYMRRTITLSIDMYVGDTVTLSLKDMGITDTNGTWEIDGQGAKYADIAASGDKLMIHAKEMNDRGAQLDDTRIYFAMYEPYSDIPWREQTNRNSILFVGNIFNKRPETMEPTFTVDTQYERTYYVQRVANDTALSCWAVEKGGTLQENTVPLLPYETFDRIHIYPKADSRVPKSALTAEGYVKNDSVSMYYIIEPTHYWVNNVVLCGGGQFRWNLSKQKDVVETLRITSRQDGTSVYLDVALKYVDDAK